MATLGELRRRYERAGALALRDARVARSRRGDVEGGGAREARRRPDADGVLRELDGEGDNTAAGALEVSLAPYADLTVISVIAPALTVGDPAQIEVTWTVRNDGTGIGLTTDWMDTVYVSADEVLGDGDDRVLAQFAHGGALEVGASYTRTETFLLAPAFSGRSTLYVRTDSGGVVFENAQEANNTGLLEGFFDVTPTAYADLVVEAIAPPVLVTR